MQPATPPPWLSSWASRALLGRRSLEYYRALARRQRQRARDRTRQRTHLTIYTYGSGDSQMFSIGGWSGRVNTVRPLAGWERYPLDSYPPDLAPAPPRLPSDLTHLPGRERTSEQWWGRAGPAPGLHPGQGVYWGGAALGAATLVALLVALGRALERCRPRRCNLPKRGRVSQAWPAANVGATRGQVIDDGTVIIPGLEHAEPLPAEWSCPPGAGAGADPPPPYCECTPPGPSGVSAPGAGADAGAGDGISSDSLHEEPPPPYGCHVKFSDKSGAPSVLMFGKKRTPTVSRREVSRHAARDMTRVAGDSPGPAPTHALPTHDAITNM